MRRFALFLLLFLAFVQVATGQSAPSTASPTSTTDPRAAALASQAVLALGTAPVTDVTLTGTVTRTVGPDSESGTFTLKALGLAQSRMDLYLPSGVFTEVRTTTTGYPQGSWMLNGNVNAMADHNCFTDAVWFFPRLSILSGYSLRSNSIVTFVGQENQAGASVYHIRFVAQDPTDLTGLNSYLSTEDVYLDSTTLLPVTMRFNAHPDDNALIDIPIEVRLSDYRVIGGIAIPFRIQKLLNGMLLLDATVQSTSLNVGLTNSDFLLQ